MQASTLRIPRPSKPSIARRPFRPAVTEVSADAVVDYLVKLSPAERATLLARVDAVRAAARPAPPPPDSRPTLNSTDLEVLADAEAISSKARSSMPPPLPTRARASVQPSPPPPKVEPLSAPPPAPVAAAAPAPVALRARSMPEVTDVLFDAMHELSFFETAIEGGSFCLVTALSVVPCLAGIVHLLDPDSGEYVAVYAQGPGSERVLQSRRPTTDALFARAAASRGPIVVDYGGDDAPTLPSRHALLGDPWSVLVVPVVRAGRAVAIIELVDPMSGASFDDGSLADSLRYIAKKYGEFIAERGVVLRSVVPPSLAEAASG